MWCILKFLTRVIITAVATASGHVYDNMILKYNLFTVQYL